MAVTEEINSIDQAISTCDNYIKEHRTASRNLLFLLILLLGTLYSSITYWLIDGANYHPSAGGIVASTNTETQTVIYAVVVIFTIIFGVVMSLYRFHLNEISKAEHYKIGFIRIRIAANNNSPGFQSEVRQTLTEQVFSFQPASSGFFKSKNVESPLPGHPTSDIATLIIDKLLDKFELVEKKKP